jgi:uncharacterized protein YjfI (DUF2170 family)
MSNSKKLGDVVLISSNSWNINNKIHLNAFLRKKDTLCSKNFSFPEAETDLIILKEGELYKKIEGYGDMKIKKENLCQKCLNVFLKNS